MPLRACFWTRCVLRHETESTAIHEKRLFPSFAIASTQAAFQTVWTLVLFTMPRNNKNLNFSSQPNSYFYYAFILRAEQLKRTHNGKIPKSHILLFFQEARQGGCQVIFFLSFPLFSNLLENIRNNFFYTLSQNLRSILQAPSNHKEQAEVGKKKERKRKGSYQLLYEDITRNCQKENYHLWDCGW